MKTLSTLLAFILTFSLFGQDVTSYGGTIYPTKESKISIEKEVLSFTVRDEIAFVDALYEFNNPESKAQKLLINFRAPVQFYDDQPSNPSQIEDFTIVQDGKVIPYKLKATLCEECELKDPNDPELIENGYGDVIFLFEITFKPGKNTIHHSFNFPSFGDMDVNINYNHSMTDGRKWAGGKIKDLTVNIDMGPNEYFFVNNSFEEAADWSIIGTGKISEAVVDYFGESPIKFIRTLSGKVQIKTSNFQSTDNLYFGKIQRVFFTSNLTDFFYMEHTKSELRIIRNTIYAQHGYIFNSADLQKHFNQFDWYMPNPNVKMEDIKLTKKEQEILSDLLEQEKK